MATSGNTLLSLSRDDIINAALRKLMVVGEGQTANANQLITATQALNAIVAEFRTLGMSIWARKGYDVVLVTGQRDYVMGVNQTLAIPYPLRIYTANLLQPPAYDTKIIVNQISFTDLSLLPDGSTGVPVNFSYQPNEDFGTMRVWPVPDSSVLAGSKINIIYQSPFQYFFSSTDTPDFPEEWYNALIYTLASSLADEFGKSMQDRQWLQTLAQGHVATALSGGAEEASMFIQRDWMGY